MKMQALKEATYQAWTKVNRFNGAIIQPENFSVEVKSRFGDRRYKVTWVKALAYFRAQASYDACLDAYMLVLNTFNFTPDRWDYEFRHDILDAFLMFPDGLELIKTGLEQLFSSDFTHKEQAEANGFLRLVEERGRQPGRERLPIGFDRRLSATVTSA